MRLWSRPIAHMRSWEGGVNGRKSLRECIGRGWGLKGRRAEPEQCEAGMRVQQSGAGPGVGGRGYAPPPLQLAAAPQGYATGGVQSLLSQMGPTRLQASTNTAATPCIRNCCVRKCYLTAVCQLPTAQTKASVLTIMVDIELAIQVCHPGQSLQWSTATLGLHCGNFSR